MSNVRFRDIANGGHYCDVCNRYIHPDVVPQHDDPNHKRVQPLLAQTGDLEFIWQKDVRDLTAAVRDLTKAVAALLPQPRLRPANRTAAKSDPN